MEFKLPELGEGVHEGELVQWRVQVGESVQYDQPLCEIMTDKATVEIPSAIQGKVARLHVQAGEVVQVGQLMMTFETVAGSSVRAADSAPASASAGKAVPAAAAAVSGSAAAPALPPSAGLPQTTSSGRLTVLAAPSTRKLAREMGIALDQVRGSGPKGRVLRDDLQAFAQRAGGASGGQGALGSKSTSLVPTAGSAWGNVPLRSDERVPFKGLRKKISEKMRLSKDRAAHFTYVEEADATELVRLRNQAKELAAQQGVKLTYLPFVMKAMVAALKKYPILNATLDEERQEIVYHHHYHIGLSVQTEEGLTAPVVKHVDQKSVLELAKDIQGLVERARSKKLTLDDVQGSTITLTNAGSIGGLFATPVINYPEVAILGLNKIFRKPVVKSTRTSQGQVQEEIVIRDWTYFSISLDHRLVDGAIGAEFMKLFIQYIENPSLLVLH
jgi:pyruvate dehydrogenase E2 component (dihydrolipoamide acetyltransferase)